ncbi:hypothetical protein [Flavobacterium sp. UBA6135]|uniref:hypothetical protein n=1 Tax=Flavobacterium sp. UBA6135 TaxID=1946553 RepID=UPI0025C2E647|nr:hypothetical protein [Flavobacterium sp. UBA6135]
MKRLLTLYFVLLTNLLSAQKNCDYAINETDSTGTYKSIKEYLLYERVFGSSENYILATLSSYNGTPYLNFKLLQKSSEFIKATCLSKKSKIYLQLENGKIITMLHEDNEVCGNLFKNEEDKKNVRLLEGNFYFLKNSIEDLKKYPISLMRVVYGTETIDYVIKKELDSELLKQFFRPESFFMNYLHCIEN